MLNFSGKTAVVTGAASGIGLELAKLFAEQQMNIVLADIEAGALDEALQTINAMGVNAIAVVTDVSKAESVEALAEAALAAFGTVHILCNNAGVFTAGHIWETSVEDYQWLINVNQWGVIHGIRSFVPRMIAQGDGCHIVNVASMAGLTSTPYVAAYTMTKHAVVALSETLFHELALVAPQINVSCLCPESVATGIAHSARNRPAEMGKRELNDTQLYVEQTQVESVSAGLEPRVLAERTLEAIKAKQFYILPPPENEWSARAQLRVDDIQVRRNPTATVGS